jgi:hypothetical protein
VRVHVDRRPTSRPEQRDVDPGLADGEARRIISWRRGAQDPLLETNAAAHRAAVVVHRVESQIGRGDGPDALTGRQGAAHPAPDDRFAAMRQGMRETGRTQRQGERSEFCRARLVPFVALSRWPAPE